MSNQARRHRGPGNQAAEQFCRSGCRTACAGAAHRQHRPWHRPRPRQARSRRAAAPRCPPLPPRALQRQHLPRHPAVVQDHPRPRLQPTPRRAAAATPGTYRGGSLFLSLQSKRMTECRTQRMTSCNQRGCCHSDRTRRCVKLVQYTCAATRHASWHSGLQRQLCLQPLR